MSTDYLEVQRLRKALVTIRANLNVTQRIADERDKDKGCISTQWMNVRFALDEVERSGDTASGMLEPEDTALCVGRNGKPVLPA